MPGNLESASIRPPEVEAQLGNPLNEAYAEQGKILREKILFGLSIYPALSPSMLHVFLGTATPARLWKDIVLTSLIEEGLVIKVETTLTSPHDRTQTYTVLHLAKNNYTAPEDTAPEAPVE